MKIVNFLKEDCKLNVGFCSQVVGNDKQSAASTAIIIYVLKKLNLLSEEEQSQYKKELLAFQIDDVDGFYKSIFGHQKDITTWTNAQVCLALLALNCDESEYIGSLLWLCSVQTENGGWTFNGKTDQESRIIYSFYSLLALSKYKGKNKMIKQSIEKGRKFVMDYEPKTTFDKILKLFMLKKIFSIEIDMFSEMDVLKSLSKDIIKNMTNYTIVESDNDGHFYISLYLPSFYMLLRSIIKPDNSLSLYFITELKNNLINGQGWIPNGQNSKLPFSWTTALSLLTIALWNNDCLKNKINEKDIINKLVKFKKEDIEMQTYIEKCPLNGGLCNKIDEINRTYSDENVFLDIPYHSKYLTFEKQIKKSINKCKLKPIMAKDTIKSKAILCKICSMIQSCKFGIADISYSTLNIPFELGLMLGLSKNCIILKDAEAKLPSDIQGLEYIEYQNTEEMDKYLCKWINDNK